MIEFIEGSIEYIGTNFIILHAGNFGFKVNVPISTLERINTTQNLIRFYTYLQAKERDFSLFGFLTREERDLFLHIIGVGGIGPKIGLSILSVFSPEKLKSIIMDEDIDTLIRIPGIGKKTAQRMILELKGTIEGNIGDTKKEGINEDIYLGLSALGYTQREIQKAFEKVKDKISQDMNINEAIKIILKVMDGDG